MADAGAPEAAGAGMDADDHTAGSSEFCAARGALARRLQVVPWACAYESYLQACSDARISLRLPRWPPLRFSSRELLSNAS